MQDPSKNRHHHPFYDVEIYREVQQAYIEKLLSKYKNEPVTEALKKQIAEDLAQEKYLGKITIPFKVFLREDPTGKFPPAIEVLLDTKV